MMLCEAVKEQVFPQYSKRRRLSAPPPAALQFVAKKDHSFLKSLCPLTQMRICIQIILDVSACSRRRCMSVSCSVSSACSFKSWSQFKRTHIPRLSQGVNEDRQVKAKPSTAARRWNWNEAAFVSSLIHFYFLMETSEAVNCHMLLTSRHRYICVFCIWSCEASYFGSCCLLDLNLVVEPLSNSREQMGLKWHEGV